MRAALLSVGVAAMAYGGWLLLSRESADQVRDVLVWLVAGVVLHDAVLSPIVILAGWLAGRLLSRPVAAAAAAVLVVLGPITLLAVPVLGRFSANPANPTLLPRDYGWGWLAVAGTTVVAAAAGTGLRELRSRQRGEGVERSSDGAGPGGR